MAVPKKVQLKKDNPNGIQNVPTQKHPKKYHLGKVVDTKTTSQNTEPMTSVSSEQHAALGARKISSGSHGGYTTGEEQNQLVAVPTSPQSDSPLPTIDIQTPSGDVDGIPSPNPEAPKEARPTPNPLKEKGPQIEHQQPSYGTGGNTIALLGFLLIGANLFVGGSMHSLGQKLFNKPEGVGPSKTKEGQALLMQTLGEVAFVILLITLVRIFPNLNRPIVIFLLGVWLVWIIFVLPDAIKNFQNQGLLAMLGITGSKDTTASGPPQKSAPGHGKTGPPKGGSYYEQGYRGNFTIGV